MTCPGSWQVLPGDRPTVADGVGGREAGGVWGQAVLGLWGPQWGLVLRTQAGTVPGHALLGSPGGGGQGQQKPPTAPLSCRWPPAGAPNSSGARVSQPSCSEWARPRWLHGGTENPASGRLGRVQPARILVSFLLSKLKPRARWRILAASVTVQ